MQPFSICMIGKNEEQNIKLCLDSLTPLLAAGAELVYTDTGSCDCTVDLVHSYTDSIYFFPWQDDFAAARNFCAKQAKHDLILVIDCDEYIQALDLTSLEKKLESFTITHAGMITRINPCSFDAASNSTLTEQIARIYHRANYHYQGIIHEQLFPTDGTTPRYTAFPLTLFHPGYQNPAITKQKALRNLALLIQANQKHPADPYTLFQLGQTLRMLDRKEEALHYFSQALSLDVNPQLDYVHTLVESYGYTLLDLKEPQKALELWGVYQVFATRADFVFLMGLIFMENGLFEDAIAQFQKATSHSTYAIEGVNSYLAYYNMGVIYECLGQKKEAEASYKKCGAYAPAQKRLQE